MKWCQGSQKESPQEGKQVRREGRRVPSERSTAGETGPEDASRCWGHGTPGPVSPQGAERDGRPLSAGPRGPISRARTGKDFFTRTGTLTVPTGHVSTGLSALEGELPTLPMARGAAFLISSTAESASFPRDRTRYWPTASRPRPRTALKPWGVSDFCGGVLCLHCCASRALSVEEGAALRLCVWASRGCGSSWGARALGHVGFGGRWVWAQRSQWPGSRARIPSARPMGFVAL